MKRIFYSYSGNLLNQKSSLRRVFGAHLKNVATALHDIEWVDSGDYGAGDELEAIKIVLDELKALGA